MLQRLKKFKKVMAVCLVLGAFVLPILSGCSSSGKNLGKNPSVKEMDSKIKETIDMKDFKQADKEKLCKLYNINSNDIEEFILYTPTSNLKANEIAIIKINNKSNVEKVKEKIDERIKKQSKSFKDYLPEEYYLIEKNVLKEKENYILFAVSKDAEKIQDIFEKSFK